jgi:Ras-related protein Rab-2A
MASPAYIFKFIIVGNSAVGKSCLLLRFDEDRFQPIHDVTVGVQEIFRSITRSYYRDSACAIIVYDITDKSSFDKIEDWIRDVRNLAPPDCLLVLFGNKLDLDAQRAIRTEQGQDLAERHGLYFFETSAATGQNVSHAFNECVTAVYTRAKSAGVQIGEKKAQPAARPKGDDGGCGC